jgi:hypothetical protein
MALSKLTDIRKSLSVEVEDLQVNGIGTFSGNVSIGGTLTYQDVTNVDSVGIVTARQGVNISGGNLQIGGTNVLNSGRALYNLEQIKLADSKELVLGSGNDLKIYHSGTHSFISEEGNGSLKFKGDDIRFEDAGGDEALRIDSSGRVLIGLTTSSTTDSNAHSKLQVASSAGPNIGFCNNSSDINDDDRLGVINFSSNHGGTYHEVATIRAAADADHASNSKASRLELYTTAPGNTQGTERLRIDSNGKLILGTEFTNAGNAPANISFYLSGVRGTYGGLDTNAVIFDNQTAAVDAGGTLELAGYSGSAAVVKAAIRGGNEGSAATYAGYFAVFTRPASGVLTEKLRITSDGKIGINDTAPERTVDVKGSNCMVQLEGTGGSGKQWSLCSADNTTGASVASAGMFAIYNDTDGVAALRVSNSNYVLRPKLPYFYATATPTAGSNNIHSFGNVHGNNGNHYNNSNGRFVAPVSGFYWFSCGIWCNSASNTTGALIQLQRYVQSSGSSTAFAGANHRTQYNSLNCSGGTYMEANDYVWIQQTSISIQSSTPRNFFSGYLVG